VGRHKQPEIRARLLEACTDYALQHGLPDRLGPLATATGTSPRMLLYHFATKDDLLRAVLRRARARQRQSFGVLGVTPGYDNPSWLAFDPMHHRLYATSEVAEWSEGLVVAYDVDVAHGKLAFAGLTASGGSSPCHIAIAADGTTLAVSNYGTASPGARGDHSRPVRGSISVVAFL